MENDLIKMGICYFPATMSASLSVHVQKVIRE